MNRLAYLRRSSRLVVTVEEVVRKAPMLGDVGFPTPACRLFHVQYRNGEGSRTLSRDETVAVASHGFIAEPSPRDHRHDERVQGGARAQVGSARIGGT